MLRAASCRISRPPAPGPQRLHTLQVRHAAQHRVPETKLAVAPSKLVRHQLSDAILFSHPVVADPAVVKLQPATEYRTELTDSEIEEIKWLRTEDPFGWSQATLAARFHVPGELIGKIIAEPREKRRAFKESHVPKIRKVIERRQWTAQNRLRRGLEPLEDEEWDRLFVDRVATKRGRPGWKTPKSSSAQAQAQAQAQA